MNKSEKQKSKDMVNALRDALPPEHRGLAVEVDRTYGEIRRSQSARDAQREAEYAARLAAARAEMKEQYDRHGKELLDMLAAELNSRYVEAESCRAESLARLGNDVAQRIRDLGMIKRCMTGGLEMYMFCDDHDEKRLAGLELAALTALTNWVRGDDAEAMYLDGPTGYAFIVSMGCDGMPTLVVGVPQRQVDRLRNPFPTRKLRRTALKFFKRKVISSIPGD